jgi:orotidine-5'-phosphate decarboxylase
MMPAFSDRLAAAVRAKGTLCVGIDPRWESLPKAIRLKYAHLPATDETRVPQAFTEFSFRVLELVEPYCGVVKPQAAFFELFGAPGMKAMQQVLQRAKEMGFVTILDAKRGDIASTATAYAEAAFGGYTVEGQTVPVWNADSLTVNPYLGRDAVEPFLAAAKKDARGIFVLVRTSNAGAGLFQDLLANGKPVYRHVADSVSHWNAATIGDCGFGDVGAVVGATHPKELAELRAAMPQVWLLVPGYGAQGGTAADVKSAYNSNGLGAIVNSSRGITFPFHPDDIDWETKITAAAQKAQTELRP